MSQISSSDCNTGVGNQQQQPQQTQCSLNYIAEDSSMIQNSQVQSAHFSKKQAYHSRQATHRRTKSQFDLQTSNFRGQSNQLISNLNGIAAHSPSATAFIGTEQQQNMLGGAQSLTCLQQQQYSQAIQFQHSPTGSQSFCSQIHENSSSSSSTAAGVTPSAAGQIQSNNNSISNNNNINNYINGKEIPQLNTCQLIQLMQNKQSLEKEQIIETIDQDFQKFNASNSMNSGFNFGKNRTKQKKKSGDFFNNTKPSELNQMNTINIGSGSNQPQSMYSQLFLSDGQSPKNLQSNSPQNQMGWSNTQSNNQNLTQSSSLNLLAMYTNHASALQTIPEQEVSLIDCPNISHPSSTRNQEDKKIVFHSHSSSYSNPQFIQQASPILPSNQPPLFSSFSSTSNSASASQQQGSFIGGHTHSSSQNSSTFQKMLYSSQFQSNLNQFQNSKRSSSLKFSTPQQISYPSYQIKQEKQIILLKPQHQ